MLYEKIDPARLNYGLVMLNHYWFMRHYWKDDLTITPSIKQRQVFSDTSKKMLLCTARKTLKTGMLEATVIRAALAKTTSRLEGYMFHTPAQAHMNPVRDRIISKLQSVATFNALITSMNRTDGVIEFATNCKWWFRIEGSSNTGKNMIGIRAEIVVGDEGAYSNEAAHRERQLTKTPTCREVWCGVPNGARGTPFFRADQTIEGKLQGSNTHHLTTLPPMTTRSSKRNSRGGNLLKTTAASTRKSTSHRFWGRWAAERLGVRVEGEEPALHPASNRIYVPALLGRWRRVGIATFSGEV